MVKIGKPPKVLWTANAKMLRYAAAANRDLKEKINALLDYSPDSVFFSKVPHIFLAEGISMSYAFRNIRLSRKRRAQRIGALGGVALSFGAKKALGGLEMPFDSQLGKNNSELLYAGVGGLVGAKVGERVFDLHSRMRRRMKADLSTFLLERTKQECPELPRGAVEDAVKELAKPSLMPIPSEIKGKLYAIARNPASPEMRDALAAWANMCRNLSVRYDALAHAMERDDKKGVHAEIDALLDYSEEVRKTAKEHSRNGRVLTATLLS